MKKITKKSKDYSWSIMLNKRILILNLSVVYFLFLISQIAALNCPNGKWACDNGVQCINTTQRCNNIIDCNDGSDEGASCNSTCSINEFKCLTSTECIRREYLCDHDKDCSDGSDEHSNCSYPACGIDQFTCENKKCISKNYICDGDNDCLDNSDEKYCASRHCPPNQLACNTTGRCIDITKFCNGISDCADGSDEVSCSSSKCSELSCSYLCRPTPKGGICFCPRGQMINPVNNRTCIDLNECDMWDECDQICVNSNNSYSCQCRANYTLLSNGHCKHQTSDNAKVIFSAGSKIYETNQNGQNLRTLFNNVDYDISSFDFNYEKNIFYFTDDKNNKVYKGTYDSTGQFNLREFINKNIQGPFSIAIDWITENVYLAQRTLSRIDVFSFEGKNRTSLVTSNVFVPTSLALDPVESYLFFTDAGFSNTKLRPAKIERVNMDGSGRKTIIKDKLLEPIAITVDLIKKRLFWIDRKYDHLETSDYNGIKRFIIASGSQNLPHSISIDLFEGTIYYADSTKLAIMKLYRHTITTESNVTYHFKLNENNQLPKFVKVYHQTKQPKLNSNPCSNSGCEHFCLLSRSSSSSNTFRCKCKIGYELRRDLKTCEKITTSLYISQVNQLRSIPLDQNQESESRIPLLMPRNGAIKSFDIDCKNNRTFFYDSFRRAVFQNTFKGDDSSESDQITPLIPDNLMSVENIAYDWVSKNLYFINTGKITVVQYENPKNRRDILIKARIYALALDPNSGFLFYSEIGRPAKIYRSFLDGKNETVLIQRGLLFPYSLSVDYESKKLFWADTGLNKIQFSDYYGNNIQTLLSSNLIIPFSIFVYKYNLFYTDYHQSNIYKTSKFYSLNPTLIRSNVNNLYQIKINAQDLQTTIDNHPCVRQNGDCSHFCFPVPSIDPQYKVSRHCGCPFGYKLSDSNMMTCVTDPNEQAQNECQSPLFFKCSNNRCIRQSSRCDGIDDCLDFSDETNCPNYQCSIDQFKCRNGTCIPSYQKCDGKFDCIDYSDEINCPVLNCDTKNYFKCNNGSCIPLSWKCDTENDCGDSSDEANCTVGQCDPITQFECHGQDGRCIDKSFVCDGDNDCLNNHDEENCPEFVCPSDQFKCSLDRICINQTKVCDGIYDCPSYTDEQNCRFSPVQTTCRENQFQCSVTYDAFTFQNRATCIPNTWVCDGHVDCDNGSDEPTTCPIKVCPPGYFRCNNSNCIPPNWKCDGEDDCGDNSDEKSDCPALPFRCGPNQYKCGGSMDVCVNLTQLCDNTPQCPDGSDEGAFCNQDDCSVQNGGCSHLCHRSPIGSICFCPNGYQTTNETNFKKCTDIDECQLEASCSQKCSNTPGSYYCLCDVGYYRTDRSSCKAITRNYGKIFITNGQYLTISNLDGTSIKSVRKASSMKRLTAFDYINKTSRIFWADRETKSIYSSYENGSNTVRIVSSGLSLVEALAVDWISENLYWADYAMQHIEVSKLDGSKRKILFNENVTNPRGLVLDPRAKSRYIFWSDWGKYPRIERANLDGSNRTVILSTKLYWPNGLSIDLIKERIYFTDAHLDYIESCDYFGNKRTLIIGNDLAIHHPHSLSYFENHLFWVDRGHRQLIKMDRFNTKNKTIITELSPQALTVKIAHSLLQPQEPNPCSRSNCEHLCLLSRNSPTGYSCDCQIGYVKDKTNPNRCNIDESEFLLVLNDNMIGGLKINSNDSIQPDDLPSEVTLNPEDLDDDASLSNIARESGFLWDRLVPINDIRFGYDFTFDFKQQVIYWLTHDQSSASINIQKIQFDGESRDILHMDQDGFPYCLDFDSSSRNLFIGNVFENQLEALNVDNYHKATILSGSQTETGVGQPIMIAVNYLDAEVYWIDNGYDSVPKKIGAVKMDGSESRNLVQNDLISPICLYFHIKSKRLYWSDVGRNKIESISVLNPADRQIIISDVEHPSGMTVWDTKSSDGSEMSILYYTDQIQEVLVAFNLKTSEKRIIKNNVPNILKLKLYQKPESIPQNSLCLINNGGCHQICLPSTRASTNGRICRCSNGLELQILDGSCRPYQSFILFATSNRIRAVPFVDSNEAITTKSEHIEALPIIFGNKIKKFDYDYKSKSIVWIEDDRLVKILNLNFSWSSNPYINQSDFYNSRVLFELDSSTGTLLSLSLDWINNLLYYSYSDPPYNYIKVTKFPSVDYHLTIFSSKIDVPSVIAVNPKLRYLYWIDQSQFSKLERSFLNGTNRTVLIKTEISTPTDLFIDSNTGDVYWSDNTKDRIEKCDWDGKNRVVIKSTNMPNPKSIFVYDKMLYYVDSRLRGLYSFNLTYSNSSTNLIKKINSFDLEEVLLFNEKSQPLNINSPCSVGSTLNNCDQFCFAMPQQSNPVCACAIGELDQNNRNCKQPKEYLIYALENEIRSVDIPRANLIGTYPWKPITGLTRAIGIDFDYRENKILFTDIAEGKISSFQVSENPVINDLITQRMANLSRIIISKPEGIAYDWVSDTIFYADNDLNQILSYKLSTKHSFAIAYSESPRAVVVHPCKGYLFWTDVGRLPMIARTSLTGSNFQKIVSTDIKWPNGLTIDFDNDKLYWADAYYDKIESSNLDGNYRQVLTTAYHPFAIVVHGHFIYWTDWNTNSIYRAEKYRGSNTIALVQGLPKRPMDIQVWSEQRQKCNYDPCSIFNGGCSHICSVAPPGNKTECRCPFGMRLRLTNNDRTCSLPTTPRCNSTQFTCANGNCISKRFVCDGIRHCTDNSDEATNYCAFHTCQASEFRCRNGRCIPMPERCDLLNQCGDNSDEAGCVYPTCNAQTEFQCRNFKCISIEKRCNGVIDCQDGNSTDEVGCPPMECNSTLYNVKCPNTNVCIMRRWLCDGDNDCGDSADENPVFCQSIPCAPNQFKCRNNQCIPYSWYCDGDRDCPGGEDEPQNTCRHGNFTCPADMFKCDSGRCINKNFVCDGDRDCPDNSDEDEERHNCINRPCRQDEFKCESGVRGRNNTKCIRLGSVCDGYPQCIKGEDEGHANCTRRQCRSNEFQCQNGLCINANYKCDHDDDCGDGSDEPRNCTYAECSSSQFKCDNLRCISSYLKCNGRNDCFDNSDERPEFCQNKTCSSGQHTCNNGTCISIDLVCNQRNDCGDNSDEIGCGVNECASPILNRCDHYCRDTLTSFKCECRPGYKLVDRYKCIDINECIETPYVCSQLCENRPGSYICKCAEGYEKSGTDSRLCKVIGPKIEADLLFTNNYYFRNISLVSNSYNLIKDGLHEATGFSYDYNRSEVYLIDSANRQLLKLKLNTSLTNVLQSSEVLLSDLKGNERGLAFDWINKKIYYLNDEKLYVCEQNGHYRAILLNNSVLQEATSLAIDPMSRYLFLTDWNYPPFIGRLSLDGKNFTKIVTADLGTPIGLTIDIITKRIFWTDTHLRKIEFSNYNGRNRYVVLQSDQTAYPYAITFYAGLIYWTDRASHSIYSADALNGSNKTTIRQGTIHSVFSLSVYHYSLQPYGENSCGNNNGGCSHLCLISSSSSTNYSCACPNSFILGEDGKTCIANCTQWHFRCGMPDEKCIPYFYKCDGEVDCKDGSDELNCPARTCTAGVFQCNNTRCIPFTQVCNGVNNCGDRSDESNCPEGCPPGRFQCVANKRCIPNDKVCDGRNDCGDFSDEAFCMNFTCPAHKFRCNSGHCIDMSYKCDEDFDCADKSDEPAFECRNRPCGPGWYRCGNNSYKCIRDNQLCDGRKDCPSGDDENPEKCPTCHSTGDFKCSNNRCIMLSLRCNNVDDCGDNSDEGPDVCSSMTRRECSESEFRCANGRCIKGTWKCDHFNDCGDNSDEQNCAAHQCTSNQWKCNSGHCIPLSQHCNGIRNCLDFSDETSCPPRYPGGKYCSEIQFTCNNTFCIDSNYACDGDNDCGDQSDEVLSLCSNYNCSKENHRFRCKNGLCIHSDNVCNGFNDCSDGSDEDFSTYGPCKKQHVVCDSNEFKCASTHICIPSQYVCDKDLDCGGDDESDELGCYNNSTDIDVGSEYTCEKNASLLCEHECHNLAHYNGFVCSCHHGFKMAKFNISEQPESETTVDIRRHTCIDIDECESVELNQCSQICYNQKGSYQCKCSENYIDSHGDGTVCEASWKEDAVFILAYGNEIRQIRENISDYSYSNLIEDENFVISIDVDPVQRYLYWVDQSTQEVKRSFIPVSRSSLGYAQVLNFIHTKADSNHDVDITALSIDWIGNNLYYADGLSKTIKVSKSDGRYSKTLVSENADLVHSLVVNPLIGMIFWINIAEHHRIMCASMNGDNVKVLVSSGLDSPDGLAIDYFMKNRLYWSDHKRNLIESINYNGTDRVQIRHSGLQDPFKIDIFENHIYWLERDEGNIKRVDKHGRGAYHNLINGLDLIADIKIFHSYKVPLNNINPCSNSTCSHLCLLKPNHEFECACPDNSNFLESDISTCDAALEDALQAPLACNCVNCWCWYNEHGVHTKCHPGWKGDLCEINSDAASRALIEKVTTISSIFVPALIVVLTIFATAGYIYYRRKNNQNILPWRGLENNIRQSQSCFTSNIQNSEISPTDINQPNISPSSSFRSKSSLGFFNPTFNKQSSEDANEIVMNEVELNNNNNKNSNQTETNIDIDSIFSKNLDQDKTNKKSKLTKTKSKKKDDLKSTLESNQYDPSTKDTFNDNVNLVETSKTSDS